MRFFIRELIWVLIGLSFLSLLFAALSSVIEFSFAPTGPEGFSNAATNLALLSIALSLAIRLKKPGER